MLNIPCYSLIVHIGSRTGHCSTQVRSPSSFANLPPYFGNIFGGLCVGAGMALTGACPGTVVVQCAVGIPSGFYVAFGGLLGGIGFVELATLLRHTSGITAKSSSRKDTTTASSGPKSPPAYTVSTKLGVKDNTVLLAYEVMCAVMIGFSAVYAPNERAYINPILGGLAIGGSQALSVLLTRKTVGVSTAYEQLGRDFWGILLPSSRAKSSSHSAVAFAIGIFLGAKSLATYVPMSVLADQIKPVEPFAAVAGGAIMVFGARLAGGCTSGHGISGMATMSLASFVTVGAMFAGGIGLKLLIG